MMQRDASGHSGEVRGTAALTSPAARVDSGRASRLLGPAADVHIGFGAWEEKCLLGDATNHCSGIRDVTIEIAHQNLDSAFGSDLSTAERVGGWPQLPGRSGDGQD
jgi:hypothetical protein